MIDPSRRIREVPARRAQLGALQIWARVEDNPDAMVTRYRHALSLGATVDPVAVYRAAGAELLLDAEAIRPLIARVEAALISAAGRE